MIDLDFFTWLEPIEDRLLVPHSDPWKYEFPVDAIFATELEARAYAEADYPDEWRSWRLVHYRGEIIQ